MNNLGDKPCPFETVVNNAESICRYGGIVNTCNREFCPNVPLYTPMPDKIFIKYKKEAATYDGRIIRPDSVKRMAFCKAEIIKASKHIDEMKAGDVVLVHKYAGYRIAPLAIEGEDFYDIVVIKKEDVLVVFEEE